MFPKTAPDSDVMDRLFPAARFHDELETETGERFGDRIDNRHVRVTDPENSPVVASLGIEDSREEALGPIGSRPRWPLHDLPNASHAKPALIVDSRYRPPLAYSSLEEVLASSDLERPQEMTRSL